jgi:hypothetical protein
MKYVSLDMEMTGLDSDTCDVLEFGAVIDDLEDVRPIEDLPTWHCYFLPPSDSDGCYKGQPYALSMHDQMFRRIANRDVGYNYYSPMKFGKHFRNFLDAHGFKAYRDKITINVAGKNFGSSDLQFLNKCTDLAKHVVIRHKLLDPAPLMMKIEDEVLPGLEECLERAGYAPNVSHTAVGDAIDVIKVLRYAFGLEIL